VSLWLSERIGLEESEESEIIGDNFVAPLEQAGNL
jgi:hypothetical protein